MYDKLSPTSWENIIEIYKQIVGDKQPKASDITQFTITKDMFVNGRAIGFHGEAHAATVGLIGSAIFAIREVKNLLPMEIIEKRNVFYQGLILGGVSHDLEATDTEKDYIGHGLRAALNLETRFKETDKRVLAIARRICQWHVPNDEQLPPWMPAAHIEIIKIAKDADGLTRKRFPLNNPAYLNETFLRFDESKMFIPVVTAFLERTGEIDSEDPAVGFGEVVTQAVAMKILKP